MSDIGRTLFLGLADGQLVAVLLDVPEVGGRDGFGSRRGGLERNAKEGAARHQDHFLELGIVFPHPSPLTTPSISKNGAKNKSIVVNPLVVNSSIKSIDSPVPTNVLLLPSSSLIYQVV